MKKLLTIVFLLIFLTGCVDKKTYKKPFVIVDKSRYSVRDSTYWHFTFIDANRNKNDFCDRNKYNIGDTIK
jgi:hypothetical protein